MLDIYDNGVGMLRIGPFNYDPLRGVDLWLEQSDDFILQHLSTTPAVEPPHFVHNVSTYSKSFGNTRYNIRGCVNEGELSGRKLRRFATRKIYKSQWHLLQSSGR